MQTEVTWAFIGRALRGVRVASHLSVAELAQSSGIPAKVLAGVEAGEGGLDSTMLRQLSATLQVPMLQFFVEAGPRDPR